MSGNTAPKRQVIKRACDGCKIRKIKCTELPPCDGCTAAGIPCTFKKAQGARGPRKLRPKTIQQITQRQKLYANGAESPASNPPPDARSTPLPNLETSHTVPLGSVRDSRGRIPVESLVLRLCVYGLRLFPVWPIVPVEELISFLQDEQWDQEIYALANAVGAATMAQLKLDSSSDGITAIFMEAECQRASTSSKRANLNSLRIAFFLHVYHENQEAGGVQSPLYLREALTLAQIMGLHREASYPTLSPTEQELRRRIIWLLFVTERGVAMLHNLPVMLKCNANFPSTDGDDGSYILSAFRKLINLFWLFDQSGAFDMLQDSDAQGVNLGGMATHQSTLDILKQRLQDIPLDWEVSNDVQRADICVTRQWMRAILWRTTRNRSSNPDQNSLSHPVQIAREFLAVISKLPTSAIEAHGPSMEFKIFEIASAVTDAMASSLRGWRLSEGARDILGQLHRILASCRGGNIALASMLYLKIAQIQDRQTLLLEPTWRIEELSDEWLDRRNRATELDFEDSEEVSELRGSDAQGVDMAIQQQLLTDGQDFSWMQNTDSELTTANGNSTDLYEQLQNFDGLLNGLLSPDSLDPSNTLFDKDSMHRRASIELFNVSSPGSIFS